MDTWFPLARRGMGGGGDSRSSQGAFERRARPTAKDAEQKKHGRGHLSQDRRAGPFSSSLPHAYSCQKGDSDWTKSFLIPTNAAAHGKQQQQKNGQAQKSKTDEGGGEGGRETLRLGAADPRGKGDKPEQAREIANHSLARSAHHPSVSVSPLPFLHTLLLGPGIPSATTPTSTRTGRGPTRRRSGGGATGHRRRRQLPETVEGVVVALAEELTGSPGVVGQAVREAGVEVRAENLGDIFCAMRRVLSDVRNVYRQHIAVDGGTYAHRI